MSASPEQSIHVGVALGGAGRHPAAWRLDSARPTELVSAQYWVDQVRLAEQGLLDLVTIEDSFSLSDSSSGPAATADGRVDLAVGHLDSTLIAARVALATDHVGLIPTAVTTHTEPFHVSKAIASLDHASHGRAGVRLRISHHAGDTALFGRRPGAEPVPDLLAEAADHAEVLRRLWDSWEDDAEIRDIATGRFIDRDKLHYIDFRGAFFSVRGPSITPRPPQGQPIIAALSHTGDVHRFVGSSADLAFVTPTDVADACGIVAEIDRARVEAGRGDAVRVLADLTVFLGDTRAQARAHRDRLDEWLGTEFSDDAAVVVGTPADVADRIAELVDPETGVVGVRLRPGAVPLDLEAIVAGVVPELQRRNLFRTHYSEETLRGHLRLPRPANRYAGLVTA
ncbi:LLM class flavin-dependent oxidoreductase [Williamsia herbipolensis]|uniref:LLM class flavin-dependent oxidoreductase n=1 Tax=Williamsia herbipolensis TaxID=1603258 RepID=A0AAU4JZR1_9NOCA|nr:LLM class flavin-dependent oxidoreductase [Williamsia herbipolensis]